MLLSSSSKSINQSLGCFLTGWLVFSVAWNPQHVNGQQLVIPQQVPQVQQPIVGPPTNVYRAPAPITQGPVYQGPVYSSPGTIINQPPPRQIPIVGQPQLINPIPQGSIPVVPPVAERIPQPVQPNQQRIQDAEQAALNAEKMAVLEKLIDKYKALAEKNQESPAELGTLKRTVAELTGQIETMRQQVASSEAEARSLQQKLDASAKDDPAAMQAAEKLATDYRNSVAQVSNLETKVQTLASENESYRAKLADLKTAMQSQPGDSEKTAALVQQVQELTSQNLELTKSKDVLMQSQGQLKEKFAEAQEAYSSVYEKQVLSEAHTSTLEARIAELTTSNENYVAKIASFNDGTPAPVQTTSFTQPAVDVSVFESKISLLNRKNRQLSTNNADLKDQNRSLNRELANLQKRHSDVTADEPSTTALVSANAPAVAVMDSTPATEEKVGWGTLGWLLPFLAIGLGIAFFVILKEEFHRPPAERSDRKN